MGRVTFLLPPDDVIMSETRTSLQPVVSSDIRRLLAKVKDTSKTKLYNNTHYTWFIATLRDNEILTDKKIEYKSNCNIHPPLASLIWLLLDFNLKCFRT